MTRDDAPVVAQSKAKSDAAPVSRMSDLFVKDTDWQLAPLEAVSLVDLARAEDENLPELAGF